MDLLLYLSIYVVQPVLSLDHVGILVAVPRLKVSEQRAGLGLLHA